HDGFAMWDTATTDYNVVAQTPFGRDPIKELSATSRTRWQRYTFPANDHANVLLNTGQALHRSVSNTVTVVDDHTVITAITRNSTLSTTAFTVRGASPCTGQARWARPTGRSAVLPALP
ncbi:alpha-L-fucosidase, partial [Streptomyces sp. NPDC056227]|uniref:alpha-L-fucosidase n=1 Tax=Streptomyces sp. NPDC056227 TaxID=3345753 RepID=UPI0035E00539